MLCCNENGWYNFRGLRFSGIPHTLKVICPNRIAVVYLNKACCISVRHYYTAVLYSTISCCGVCLLLLWELIMLLCSSNWAPVLFMKCYMFQNKVGCDLFFLPHLIPLKEENTLKGCSYYIHYLITCTVYSTYQNWGYSHWKGIDFPNNTKGWGLS